MKRAQAMADASRALREAFPDRADEILSAVSAPDVDPTISAILAFFHNAAGADLRVTLRPAETYGRRGRRTTGGYEVRIERGTRSVPVPRPPNVTKNITVLRRVRR